MGDVAIIGVGMTPLRASTADLSYKELIFQAALKADDDASVDPRRDIESFVASSEALLEGLRRTGAQGKRRGLDRA